MADGTSTLAWKASVSSSGTTTISSCLRESRSIVVSSDGLDRSRNARSILRSGRIDAHLVDEGGDGGGGAGVPAAMSQGHQSGSGHQRGLLSVFNGVLRVEVSTTVSRGIGERGHRWMPHSVLLVPAQRPLRGSSPGATRRVQGAQPIEG